MRSKRNKFERVQGHAGPGLKVPVQRRGLGPGGGVSGQRGTGPGGVLHAEVQCIMGNGHMGTPPGGQKDRD